MPARVASARSSSTASWSSRTTPASSGWTRSSPRADPAGSGVAAARAAPGRALAARRHRGEARRRNGDPATAHPRRTRRVAALARRRRRRGRVEHRVARIAAPAHRRQSDVRARDGQGPADHARHPGRSPLPVAANVVRLVQQRLAGLTPEARRVARCAAVAGQDSDSRLIAAVLGRTPIELGDAFAELEAAHLLGGGGQFAHDLVAEAALASVPQAIEGPLHADVAQFLETHRDAPGRTAEHWLAAALPLRAAPLLLAAGEQSLAAWRPDEAAPLPAGRVDLRCGGRPATCVRRAVPVGCGARAAELRQPPAAYPRCAARPR